MEFAKVRRMSGSNLTWWPVRLHMVTVAAVILAILISALAMDSKIDHRILSTQSANEMVIEAGGNIDASKQTSPNTNCHPGYNCSSVIVPTSSLELERFVSLPEGPTDARVKPNEVKYLLFHPPRRLSQV